MEVLVQVGLRNSATEALPKLDDILQIGLVFVHTPRLAVNHLPPTLDFKVGEHLAAKASASLCEEFVK